MKWTVLSLVRRASEILSERGIKTPRLDAEILMCHALGWDNRVKVYTNYDRPLTEEEVERYRRLISRRAKGEPVAYIVGYKDFYGLRFKVRKGVLIPRPETEILVEKTVDEIGRRYRESLTLVDVGTGSGCIVISICRNVDVKGARFIGTDISDVSLEVARENAEELGCRVDFIKSDLLEGVKGEMDVVVSNPPYIPLGDRKVEENVVKYEPHPALFGGRTGLELIERLSFQAYRKLRRGGFISLEFGIGQSGRVVEILKKAGFSGIKIFKDLSGIERVAMGFKES